MIMPNVHCPKCGASSWKAIESGSWLVSCELLQEDDQIVIEMDAMAEFMHEAISSSTIAYTCGSGECGYTITADRIMELRAA